jgi:hypothetical protein
LHLDPLALTAAVLRLVVRWIQLNHALFKHASMLYRKVVKKPARSGQPRGEVGSALGASSVENQQHRTIGSGLSEACFPGVGLARGEASCAGINGSAHLDPARGLHGAGDGSRVGLPIIELCGAVSQALNEGDLGGVTLLLRRDRAPEQGNRRS